MKNPFYRSITPPCSEKRLNDESFRRFSLYLRAFYVAAPLLLSFPRFVLGLFVLTIIGTAAVTIRALFRFVRKRHRVFLRGRRSGFLFLRCGDRLSLFLCGRLHRMLTTCRCVLSSVTVRFLLVVGKPRKVFCEANRGRGLPRGNFAQLLQLLTGGRSIVFRHFPASAAYNA